MQAGKRKISPGWEYDPLFPRAELSTEIIKGQAKLEDTIRFLPKAIADTGGQTKKIAALLKGKNTFDTCKRIWHWVFKHIQYEKDEKGKEQIRSPQRTWHDRFTGVDCDDYTVLISSMLCKLRIPHLLRVAMYDEDNGFQHIYPVAFDTDGTEIIIDCVLDEFNVEVPTLKKIDQTMELQFLNGLPDKNQAKKSKSVSSIDADDLMGGWEDLGELGLKLKAPAFVKKAADSVKTAAHNVGKKAGEAVHAINRVNPAMALLRLGVLVSLKNNLFKVAENLRHTYITDEEARQRAYDHDRFKRLIAVRERLASIFYGAGGNEANLRDAILKHKGKREKDDIVAGLGSLELCDTNTSKPISEIIGNIAYASELNGVEGLGDPATAAAVTAAAGAIGAIAALIKNIGSLKKNKDNGSNADNNTQTTNSEQVEPMEPRKIVKIVSDPIIQDLKPLLNSVINEPSNSDTPPPVRPANTSIPAGASSNENPAGGRIETRAEANGADTVNASSSGTKGTGTSSGNGREIEQITATKGTAWEKFKGWVDKNKTAIAIGSGLVIAASIAGYFLYKQSNKTNPSATSPQKPKPVQEGAMYGVKSKRKKKKEQKIKIHKLK